MNVLLFAAAVAAPANRSWSESAIMSLKGAVATFKALLPFLGPLVVGAAAVGVFVGVAAYFGWGVFNLAKFATVVAGYLPAVAGVVWVKVVGAIASAFLASVVWGIVFALVGGIASAFVEVNRPYYRYIPDRPPQDTSCTARMKMGVFAGDNEVRLAARTCGAFCREPNEHWRMPGCRTIDSFCWKNPTVNECSYVLGNCWDVDTEATFNLKAAMKKLVDRTGRTTGQTCGDRCKLLATKAAAVPRLCEKLDCCDKPGTCDRYPWWECISYQEACAEAFRAYTTGSRAGGERFVFVSAKQVCSQRRCAALKNSTDAAAQMCKVLKDCGWEETKETAVEAPQCFDGRTRCDAYSDEFDRKGTKVTLKEVRDQCEAPCATMDARLKPLPRICDPLTADVCRVPSSPNKDNFKCFNMTKRCDAATRLLKENSLKPSEATQMCPSVLKGDDAGSGDAAVDR